VLYRHRSTRNRTFEGRHVSWYQRYGEQELHATPVAWQSTVPGKALDGKPKFDLMKFEPVYFQRLRSRVEAARDRGIYVSIMLFGGYQEADPNWTGNPLHRDNNIIASLWLKRAFGLPSSCFHLRISECPSANANPPASPCRPEGASSQRSNVKRVSSENGRKWQSLMLFSCPGN
jgi:hypothetical protein